MLAAVELTDHGLGRSFEESRRNDAADACPGAGDNQPVAAVDAFALFARQFVGHLQRRFATGAINLHGNETPGLARERYRKDEKGRFRKLLPRKAQRPLVLCQSSNDGVAEFARIRIALELPNSCEFSYISNQD